MERPESKQRDKNSGIAFKLLNSGGLIPLVILLVWWYGSKEAWWSPFLLPGPLTVLSTFNDLLASGELVANISTSIGRIVKGFVLASLFALFLALLCGIYRQVCRQLMPLITFIRHVPPMATIPMIILWFGIGEASKLVIIMLATFFPVFMNTHDGIQNSDAKLAEVGYVFGYTRGETIRHIVIPGAFPYIITGMKLGIGYSWRSLIAAELVAASSGLGYMILNAEQLARPDVILVGIIVIGVLGTVMDLLFSLLTNIYNTKRGRDNALA